LADRPIIEKPIEGYLHSSIDRRHGERYLSLLQGTIILLALG